mmetsp:Transcript_12858/g.22098  ORF Transcript_12858/g.22098 Transcript_12858/m.22098 type:complete len:462 (-) Transcript_12858:1171-2556(-)
MEASRSALLPANTAGGCGPGGGAVASRLTAVRDASVPEGQVLVAAGVRDCLVAALASFPDSPTRDTSNSSDPQDAKEDSDSSSAKVPVPATLADSISIELGCSPRRDLTSVSSCGFLVAASDCRGGGLVARLPSSISDISDIVAAPLSRHLRSSSVSSEPSSKRPRVELGASLRFAPGSNSLMPSWSHVAFPRISNCTSDSASNSEPDFFAVSHGLGRLTQIVDVVSGRQKVSMIHSQAPGGLVFVDPHTFVALEWGSLSLWDVRSAKCVRPSSLPGNSGGVFPIPEERTPWLCADVSEDGLVLALANESRTVAAVDLRSWRTTATWRAPIKHEPVAVRLAGAENRCFVAGRDHELVGCRLEDMARKSGVATVSKKQKKQQKNKMDEDDNNNSNNENVPEGPKTVTPQSVPVGSLLHQNHRTFRSEATWAGVDLWQPKNSESTKFVGLTTSGILYAGNYYF